MAHIFLHLFRSTRMMSGNMSNNPSPRVVLSQLLSPDVINLRLAGSQRDEVLVELVDQIKQLRDQPNARETLLHALREREQLHSTGIGDGIALPHARNALVGLLDCPVLVFGRHAEGVPYGAIDGAPARLFFLLVAPNVTLHLAMLARLSRILRDPKLRKALLTAESPEKVVGLIRDAEVEV
jgi:mannitol/fructose-specific phosphotransferase system IIA component (Ntr-type)